MKGDFKLKLSELLVDAHASFEAPENLESIEICLDKAISSVTFYPWIRAVGKEALEEISKQYDEFSKQHKGTPYLKVFRSFPPQFFFMELHVDS